MDDFSIFSFFPIKGDIFLSGTLLNFCNSTIGVIVVRVRENLLSLVGDGVL